MSVTRSRFSLCGLTAPKRVSIEIAASNQRRLCCVPGSNSTGPPDPGLGGIDMLEDDSDPGSEVLTLLCQVGTMSRAGEELQPDFILETRDALGQAGLGRAKVPASCSKAAVPDNRVEISQLLQRHLRDALRALPVKLLPQLASST